MIQDNWDKYNDVQKKITSLADSLGVTEVHLRKNAKNFDLIIRLQVQHLLIDKLTILETIHNKKINKICSSEVVSLEEYKCNII
jgi:hypothetical protein